MGGRVNTATIVLYVLFQMMFETRDRECLGVSTLQKSLDVFAETWKTIKVEDLRGSESVKEVVKELREMIVQVYSHLCRPKRDTN